MNNEEALSSAQESNKVVSILFVDIVGSTELLALNNADETRACINNIINIITEISSEFDGEVIKTLGDGVKIGFGINLSIEDHSLKAAYAALKMIRECRETTEKKFPNIEYKGIRAGLHSGYVLLIDKEEETGNGLNRRKDTFGLTTNIAAKLQTHAPIDHLCLSESSQKLLKGALSPKRNELISIGNGVSPIFSFKIDGFDFEDSALKNESFQSSGRIIGRKAELSEIQKILDFNDTSNQNSLLISGEAGIGKTRVIEEITHNLTARSIRNILTKAMHVTEKTPFFLIRQILKNMNIEEYNLNSAETNALQILKSMDLDAIQNWRLDEVGKIKAIFQGIIKIIKQMIESRPVAIIVEDLHYLDKESLRFLTTIIDFASAQHNIKIIASTRLPISNDLENLFETHQALSPLNSEESSNLIHSLSETLSLEKNSSVKNNIISRSKGNPLTITELTRLELRESTNRQKRSIPVAIEPLLRKRLEFISPNARILVNYLGLFGHSITFDQARKLTQWNEKILSHIIFELMEAGIIKYNVEGRLIFTHDLYRETCAASLTEAQKISIHEKIFDALRADLESEKSASNQQTLARHAFRSGHLEEGLEYSKTALSIANDIGAIRTVRDLFLEICDYCELCENSDYFKARFGMLSFDAIQRLAEENSLLDIYLNAINTSEKLFSTSELIVLKSQLSVIYWTTGQASKGLVYAADAAKGGAKSNHLGLESVTVYSLACIEFSLGFLESSVGRIEEHTSKVPIELNKKKWGQSVSYPSIVLRTFGTWFAVDAGKFDVAKKFIQVATETEKKFPNSYGNVLTKLAQGYLYYRLNDFARSAPILSKAYETAKTSALSLAPMSAAWAALTLLELDDVKTAQKILDDEYTTGRYEVMQNANRGYFFLAKAKVLSKLENHEDALKWLERAISDTSSRGDSITLAYCYAAYPDVAAQSNQVDSEKIRYLKNALQIAKECGMIPLMQFCEKKLSEYDLFKL